MGQSKIKTFAFIGPLLPHYVWQEKQLEKLFKQLKKVGVNYIYLEHLNLSNQIKERLFKFLKKDYPELLVKFEKSLKPEYRNKLDKLIQSLIKKNKQLKNSSPKSHLSPQQVLRSKLVLIVFPN